MPTSTGPGEVGSPVKPPVAVKPTLVVSGLGQPHSLAFLPDGRMLVPEQIGRLRILTAQGGMGAPLDGLPASVTDEQAGLFDVALGPTFGTDRTIYFTYVEGGASGNLTAVLARATLGETALSDVQVLYRQVPALPGSLQFGGAIAFDDQGHVFLSLGDRHHQELVQQLNNTVGKIVRLNLDGSVPADNPFVGRADVLPEIWTWGHRNPQGLAVDPVTRALYEVEHGAKGGDELNLIERGLNYGWPRITSSRDYQTDLPVGEAAIAPDVRTPLIDFAATTVAPSGMTIYRGTALPGWDGSILIGGLKSKQLLQIGMVNGVPSTRTPLLTGLDERIRNVAVSPSGVPWVVTDSGNVYRLDPA